MKKEDLSHIIIFGGSLSELNEKYQDRKYEIADNFFTNTLPNSPYNIFTQTRKELIEEGYDGIIRANFHRIILWAYFSGLPVRRVK